MSEPQQSRATRVTLYEDRAEVTRRARVRAGAGQGWVQIAGITPYIDDRSLQTKVITGTAELLTARVRRRMVTPESADTQPLQEACDSASQDVTTSARDVERTSSAARRLENLQEGWFEALSAVPTLAGQEDVWWQTWRRLRQSQEDALRARVEGHINHDRLIAQRDLAKRRLQDALVQNPRCESIIEVQLSSDTDTEVELELVYRTPCALWRPEHLARLVGSGDDARVEWTTWATAWQITGEDWDGVEVVFSTARPASIASAPLLEDDVVISRRKSREERRQVVVEVREQSFEHARSDGGAAELDLMPGVDDGGEPIMLRGSGPVALPSSGEPTRVEVLKIDMRAAVEPIVMPEKSPVAHLKASLTWSGQVPLLAGPLRVAREAGMVGRSSVDFVGAGEPFVMGFGPDDALRVRRVQTEKRDTVPVIGTQKLARHVTLYVSNLSDEPRSLNVIERIPVSEIDAVEIDLTEARGWTLNDRHGLLTRQVTLGGNQGHEASFRYEITASPKVVLPF